MKKRDRNAMIQTPIEEPIMKRLREKIYNRSDSRNSLVSFDYSIKVFDRYMKEMSHSITGIAESPISMLDEYLSWLKNQYSPRTIRVHISSARKFLKAHGVKIPLEEFNDIVVLPKKRPFEDKKVSIEQIRRIMLACTHSGLKLQLMFIKDTMARPGEIAGLQLKHLYLDEFELPYLKIPSELSKNDIPRKLFFTLETKDILKSYLREKFITEPDDYLFLLGYEFTDRKDFQAKLQRVEENMIRSFRYLLAKPEFVDLNKRVEGMHRINRYEIHPYSFKKFAYTVVSKVLGESAAKAMKGDSDYTQTYYKQTMEEKMEDYRKVISKLSVFGASKDVRLETKQQLDNETSGMSEEQLQGWLKSMRDSKNPSKW